MFYNIMQVLLEITLSDWTPTNPNPFYKYLKLFLNEGNIVMTQFVRYQNDHTKKRLSDKVISSHPFTPLEIGILKQNLDTLKKFTETFVISLPALGLEYDLEKCVCNFEAFVKEYKKETFYAVNNRYRNLLSILNQENNNYQKELAQLQRNYNKYKAEFNEFVADYYKLFDTSLCAKHVDLLNRNKVLEAMFEKEKYEKEQFIAYCNNLNEKIMEFTYE